MRTTGCANHEGYMCELPNDKHIDFQPIAVMYDNEFAMFFLQALCEWDNVRKTELRTWEVCSKHAFEMVDIISDLEAEETAIDIYKRDHERIPRWPTIGQSTTP